MVVSWFKSLKLSRRKIVKKLIFVNNGSTDKIVTEFKISENTLCVNEYLLRKSSNSYILDYIHNRERCFFCNGGIFNEEN